MASAYWYTARVALAAASVTPSKRAIATTKDGVKQEVTAKDDGRSVLSNLGNILFGSATPHNCYGTSRTTPGCDQQWEGVPKSKAIPIKPNVNFKPPVLIPHYENIDYLENKITNENREQMRALLNGTSKSPMPIESNVKNNGLER